MDIVLISKLTMIWKITFKGNRGYGKISNCDTFAVDFVTHHDIYHFNCLNSNYIHTFVDSPSCFYFSVYTYRGLESAYNKLNRLPIMSHAFGVITRTKSWLAVS